MGSSGDTQSHEVDASQNESLLVPNELWVEELKYSIKKKQIKYKKLEISGLIVIFILDCVQTYIYISIFYAANDRYVY